MPGFGERNGHPARFEDLADASADVVFVLDRETRVVFVNRIGAALLGRRPEKLTRRTQAELFPEPLAARHSASAREVLQTGQPCRTVKEDVDGLWLETNLHPIRDSAGQVVGVLGIARDVTAERLAHESERRYRATFEHATVGIANLSLAGRFIGGNERLCGLLGRSAAELVGKNLRDLLHADDVAEFDLRLADLGRGHGSWFVREVRCLRGDGAPVWVRAAVSLVRDDGDQPHELVAVLEDISAGRLLEERLRHAEKLEAIGQVAGGVAHDFNNQLTAIIGYADLLERRLEGEPQRRYVTNILESARRSASLTRQLLAFARKGQFQRAAVDVHLLVGEITDILERSIDKRIRIERELRADSAVVTGDASLLQNALLNLALNARDAMPDGGQIRFATEAVALGRGESAGHPPELGPGRYVTVTVSDTGCGMGEPVLSRLFEPFFTTKEPGKGTGLGLAAVFGTVQRHGGAISVESTVGHGSSFRIYLPLGRETGVEEAAPRGETSAPASGCVLVIDDEPLVREMASEILGAGGFRVATSENGRLGVEHYRRHWPEIDLVLLDLAMPEMDGNETFLWLRRLNPSARVLLCSGYSSEGDAQALLARGAVGFVQKPFDRTTLLQSVSDALAAPSSFAGEQG